MRLRSAVSAVCVLLLVVACHGGQVPADDPGSAPPARESAAAPAWPAGSTALAGDEPPVWWPVARSRELAPTGIEVVARSEVKGMAADGRGDVWLYGPWLVARVDPATGGTEVWDVSDDLAFAGTTRVRPARSGGVWLVSNEAVRLFDGQRFQRDLPVPEEFRGGPLGAVTDVIDLGSQVWVGSAAGVARCAGGGWSWVDPGRITHITALEVDRAGSVWATGQVSGRQGRSRAAARFDGQVWLVPGGDGVPGYAYGLVLDPAGGVLVRTFAALHRFVGGSWLTVAELASPWIVGGGWDSVMLRVDRAGVPWVVGENAVARQRRSGGWQVVARRQGGVGPLVGLAVVGGDVLVADAAGALRVEGDQLRRVGRTPCLVLSSSAAREDPYGFSTEANRPLTIEPEGLLPVSSEELWATVHGYGSALHFSRGRWREADLGSPLAWDAVPALASDGAVWLGVEAVEGGLVRIVGERPERIPDAPWAGTLHPAPDGRMWVVPSPWYGWWYAESAAQGQLDGRALGLLEPDGASTLIPLPDDVWSLPAVFPAPDGGLWATSCQDAFADPCPNPPDLLHWDGQWSTVAYPGYGISVVGVGGQSLWASLFLTEDLEGPAVLASFSQGTWTTFPEAGALDSLMVGPDGTACGMDEADRALVCVDRAGRIGRWDIGLGGDIRIAPDGSVWLVDSGLVARLPVSLPMPAAAPEQ